MLKPGELVRIKPTYEGYGCKGFCYVVEELDGMMPDMIGDADAWGPGDEWRGTAYKIYVSSLDRLMTFYEYELEIAEI